MTEEERSEVLYSSGFEVTEARIPSWDKATALRSMSSIIKEINSDIPSPVITKVTNVGATKIIFSNKRFIEEKDLSY